MQSRPTQDNNNHSISKQRIIQQQPGCFPHQCQSHYYIIVPAHLHQQHQRDQFHLQLDAVSLISSSLSAWIGSIDFHWSAFHQVFCPVHHMLIHNLHTPLAASCQLKINYDQLLVQCAFTPSQLPKKGLHERQWCKTDVWSKMYAMLAFSRPSQTGTKQLQTENPQKPNSEKIKMFAGCRLHP